MFVCLPCAFILLVQSVYFIDFFSYISYYFFIFSFNSVNKQMTKKNKRKIFQEITILSILNNLPKLFASCLNVIGISMSYFVKLIYYFITLFYIDLKYLNIYFNNLCYFKNNRK